MSAVKRHTYGPCTDADELSRRVQGGFDRMRSRLLKQGHDEERGSPQETVTNHKFSISFTFQLEGHTICS
jgi:hypothetical protein